jgi:hypothetical protein
MVIKPHNIYAKRGTFAQNTTYVKRIGGNTNLQGKGEH